jgi:hypothetical protein
MASCAAPVTSTSSSDPARRTPTEFSQRSWLSALPSDLESVRVRIPSRDTLIINKRASGRPKDLEDADRLEEV